MIMLEEMNKDTTLGQLLEYLEWQGIDKVARKELTSYEQGVIVGNLNFLDMIKVIVNEDKG